MRVSTEVSTALVNQSGGQLATLAAIVLDPALMDKGYPAALQRAATDARLAPKSDKTWANYVSTARAVLIRVADLFPGREPAAFELADRLGSELRKGGYFTQADDVTRWAKGKPAIVAATKAKAAAAAAAATVPAATVPAAAAATVPAATVPAAAAATVPAAAAATVPAVDLLTFGQLGLEYVLTVQEIATDADLFACIRLLQSALDSRIAAATATATA